jgi:hypothetical protein
VSKVAAVSRFRIFRSYLSDFRLFSPSGLAIIRTVRVAVIFLLALCSVGVASAAQIKGASAGTKTAGSGVPQVGASVFTTLDAPNAGTSTREGTVPFLIDPLGDIAGMYLDSNKVAHGFVLPVHGTLTSFDAPGVGSDPMQGTFPTAMDAAGDIAGVYKVSDETHGFVRLANGTITTFDPGGSTSRQQFVVAMDAAGDITGGYKDAYQVCMGFIRAANGTITAFAAPDVDMSHTNYGDPGIFPTSINAAGEIAGSWQDAEKNVHGFVRTADGTVTSIEAPEAGSSKNQGTLVTSISATGQVAGVYLDGNKVAHSFVRSAEGNITTFDATGAGTEKNQGTYALSIDAAGDIVGTYSDAANVGHGFLRTADGTITSISIPGAATSAPQMKAVRNFLAKHGVHPNGIGVNGVEAFLAGTGIVSQDSAGDVAGAYFDSDQVSHGFARSAGGSITTFDDPGAGGTAYQGTAAFAINASRTITGIYVDGSGVLHGYMATLPTVWTTTTLSSQPNPSVYGQAVTFSTTVTANSDTVPDGESVSFMQGTTTLGTEPLSGGAATFTTTSLGVGNDSITAQYTGDSKFGGSASQPVIQGVGKASSTTSLSSNTNPSTYGQAVTLKASVSGQFGGLATGTVTFSFNGAALGTADLSGGVASLTTNALPVSADQITAVYGGSASFTGSTSDPVSQVVGPGISIVTVTPSSSNITNVQVLTEKVLVTGAGQTVPTGTVTLTSGTYSAQQTLVSASASFSIPAGTLSAGDNTLTFAYSGDGSYLAATAPADVTVSPVVVDVPAPAPVVPGAVATAAATVNAGTNYSGTINLTCSLTGSPTGATSLPTCSLNPATVTIAAGASVPTTLTVKTTASSATAQSMPFGQELWRFGGAGAALAAVMMFGIPSRRRRWMSMIALLLIAVAGAIGCGGSTKATTPTTPTTPAIVATTSGNYVFTVTGVDSTNAKITTSTSVTVTVQ